LEGFITKHCLCWWVVSLISNSTFHTFGVIFVWKPEDSAIVKCFDNSVYGTFLAHENLVKRMVTEKPELNECTQAYDRA
jgi:hypothetical protein